MSTETTATPVLRRYCMVIALDQSEYAEIVLEHALDQAGRHQSLDLHFTTVIEPDQRAESAKRWLASLVLEGLDSFRGMARDWNTRLHLISGSPVEGIAEITSDLDADLLVIGRFGTHGDGSVCDDVLERTTCPALVVRLGGHLIEAHPQCPACVEVRQESEGERWFCDAHAGQRGFGLTTLPLSTRSVQGGPLL